MNAFEFGITLQQKLAAAAPLSQGQTPDPREFPISDARVRMAKLPPAAFQQVGLQTYHPDWSAGQVWDAVQKFQNAQPVSFSPNMKPGDRAYGRQFNGFQTWTSNTARTTKPPVLKPGAPGAPAVPQPAPAPAPAPAAAPVPPQPRPVQPAPAPANPAQQFGQNVAQAQPQGVIPGRGLPVSRVPLAPGKDRDSRGVVGDMSPEYIRLMQENDPNLR